jgi:hypothetical protein
VIDFSLITLERFFPALVVFTASEMTRLACDSMLRSHPRATRSNSSRRATAVAIHRGQRGELERSGARCGEEGDKGISRPIITDALTHGAQPPPVKSLRVIGLTESDHGATAPATGWFIHITTDAFEPADWPRVVIQCFAKPGHVLAQSGLFTVGNQTLKIIDSKAISICSKCSLLHFSSPPPLVG